MIRNRKKVCFDHSRKAKVIVIDSETDQPQEVSYTLKKIKNKEKCQHVETSNLYEKIKEIPEYTLTKDQMNEDPIALITKLQEKYIQYGAVKIKACPQWNPPFCFKYTEKGITTRIQKVHKLKQGKAFDEKLQEYNIKSFSDFADRFQKSYKMKFQRSGSTNESQMENQYWQIVKGIESDDPKLQEKYKVHVQYAADLPSHQYGSGFPQFQSSKTSDEHFNYATSHFNLNNLYKADSSILGISQKNNQKISGVTIPWVYMGMQFSTFCWHVQDLWLNSINYSHKGATKTWYIIPQSDKPKFDAYVLKKTGKRQLLNSITFMIDPLELMNHGIKIYKAYQRPRQYILTLFNAYHCGFSQGFNVGEAVNVGTIQSFDIIRKADAYSAISNKSHKPPVLCYQWLVVANTQNPAINQQKISNLYRKILAKQLEQLKDLLHKSQLIGIQTIDANIKYDRNSCHTCKYYQYISFTKCTGCQKKYCIKHTDKCCGKGFILFFREGDGMRKKNIDFAREKIIK